MNLEPLSKSENIKLSYNLYSGNDLTLNTTSVMMPRVPSEPKTN